VLRFVDLSLDTGTRQASRGGRAIELTTKEYELLALLLRHPRRVLTHAYLLQQVWGYDFEGESNVVPVFVGQLRQKLEAAGEPRLIHTVRRAGYVLRE
jgi:two-component system response regulator MprA